MKQKYRLLFSFFTVFLLFFGLVRCARTEAASEFLLSWVQERSDWGGLNEPFDAAVGPNGYLYVTDARQKKVFKFNSEGQFILQWGGAERFEKQTGITVSADGFVYVSDYDKDLIQKFTNDGHFITQWGRSGEGKGEFDSPYGLL